MLTKIKNILILSFVALLVTSCSTLSKNECKTANWNTIGYEDGTNGYQASRIGEHRSACADYGIRPNLNAYTEGRKKGLQQFCIPSTAYNKGLHGYRYNGVCANYNERAFLAAYNHGLSVYKAKNVLNKLKNDYKKEADYIALLERKLHDKEDVLVSGRLSKVKALIILNETKEIAEVLGKAKVNIDLLASDIDKQAAHVNYLKNN